MSCSCHIARNHSHDGLTKSAPQPVRLERSVRDASSRQGGSNRGTGPERHHPFGNSSQMDISGRSQSSAKAADLRRKSAALASSTPRSRKFTASSARTQVTMTRDPSASATGVSSSTFPFRTIPPPIRSCLDYRSLPVSIRSLTCRCSRTPTPGPPVRPFG